MDNEQIFELMTKMYADLKQGQEKMYNELKQGQTDLSSKIDSVNKKVDKTNITIENNITPKIEALFDGYKQNTEQLTRIENNVNTLSDKVDKHDIKIQVIEGGKGKNLK